MRTREELKGALGRCVDIYTWIRLGPGRDPGGDVT